MTQSVDKREREEKNGGPAGECRWPPRPENAAKGGAVKSRSVQRGLGALALLAAGLGLGILPSGCNSAPALTADQAKAMIQAKYDATLAAGAHIVVNRMGLKMGITDGFWKLTKVYPNKFWADYTLTDEGKKAVVPDGSGDVIQWRPDSMGDTTYMVTIETVAANHLKAMAVKDPVSEELPGASAARSVGFNEVVDMTGVPQGLRDIAEEGMSPLSTKRQADFTLVNGKWVLKSIS